MITHLQADRMTRTVGHNGSAIERAGYEVAIQVKGRGPEGSLIMESNIVEAIAEGLGWDTSAVRYGGAFPIVEFLHIRPSKLHNGFDTECRVFGRTLDGLRIPEITMVNVLRCVGEYVAHAWAGAKVDAAVTDFDMTVERNSNG